MKKEIMQVHLRRGKLWNGESQTAPQNMDDSQPLHLPYTTAGKHHRSEKLVVFMHNTDIALRKRWQKTIST